MYSIGNNPLNKTQKAQQPRESIDKLHKIKKLLHKQNGHKIEETAHRMEEYLF
jgi:hypothetical protein